jgi:hypothetical protein
MGEREGEVRVEGREGREVERGEKREREKREREKREREKRGREERAEGEQRDMKRERENGGIGDE